MITNRIHYALFILLASKVALAQQGGQKAVILLNGQIAVVSDGKTSKLTDSDTFKLTPVWSPDGKQIAYLDEVEPNTKLPEIVVMDQIGHVSLRAQLFPKYAPGEQVSAIVPRSLGLLGYAAPSELLVEGSVNRWVCDYLLINAQDGSIVEETMGECGRTELLPDRRHLLTEPNLRSGPPIYWRDYLSQDGKQLYPTGSAGVRFLSAPSCSPDGSFIAIAERNLEDGSRSLVILPKAGPANLLALPASFGAVRSAEDEGENLSVTLLWRAGGIIMSDGISVFRALPGAAAISPVADLDFVKALTEEKSRWERIVAARQSSLRALTGIKNPLESIYDVWPIQGDGLRR